MMASNSKMCYDVGMRCGHPSAHTYGLLLEKEFFMETYNDQLFPPAFLVNYTKEPAGRQRVLTYSLFRFLSCVSEEHPDLAQFLADQVSCPSAEDSFEILEDYLSADDYFSPSIAADGRGSFRHHHTGYRLSDRRSCARGCQPALRRRKSAAGCPARGLPELLRSTLPVPDASHGRTGCFAAAVFKCIPSGISLQLRVFCSL